MLHLHWLHLFFKLPKLDQYTEDYVLCTSGGGGLGPPLHPISNSEIWRQRRATAITSIEGRNPNFHNPIVVLIPRSNSSNSNLKRPVPRDILLVFRSARTGGYTTVRSLAKLDLSITGLSTEGAKIQGPNEGPYCIFQTCAKTPLYPCELVQVSQLVWSRCHGLIMRYSMHTYK